MHFDDESPDAWWSDDDLRNWARARGYGRSQKAKVRLMTVHPSYSDLAIIHFDVKGCPIERVKDARL